VLQDAAAGSDVGCFVTALDSNGENLPRDRSCTLLIVQPPPLQIYRVCQIGLGEGEGTGQRGGGSNILATSCLKVITPDSTLGS
jgi:hypothetical protein